MNIADILTSELEVTSPDESLAEAARRMKDSRVGILPVCSHDRLVGVVTDRDIVVRAAAFSANLERTQVHEIMSSPVVTCYDDQSVDEVNELMEAKQVRRVLVLDRENDLIGVVSLGDIALQSESAEDLERAA